uniref:hypothetical protein n=1 Tax=Polynucleobacter sp. TaxID=2029855 RepID=UPI004048D508
MKKILLMIFCCTWVNFSFGQEVPKLEGKNCSTLDGRLDYINKLSKVQFDWLLKKVERVPPDIEKYISLEYQESIDTRNEVKYNNVVSNKFFHPWKLRNSIKNFETESKEGFRRIRYGDSNQITNHKFEMFFYTNLLEKYYIVSEEFDTYGRFDRGRKPKVLDDQKDSFTFALLKGMYISKIQDLIECSFKK